MKAPVKICICCDKLHYELTVWLAANNSVTDFFASQDKYDLRVFRLCALWFANSNNSTVNKLIKVHVAGMCECKLKSH